MAPSSTSGEPEDLTQVQLDVYDRGHVRTWLDFSPEHTALAGKIAAEVADRAAVVGSGRVGRTRLLSVEERAALAARASIRHRYTDHERQPDRFGPLLDEWDDVEYQRVKGDAQAQVDEFLANHRRRRQPSTTSASRISPSPDAGAGTAGTSGSR